MLSYNYKSATIKARRERESSPMTKSVREFISAKRFIKIRNLRKKPRTRSASPSHITTIYSRGVIYYLPGGCVSGSIPLLQASVARINIHDDAKRERAMEKYRFNATTKRCWRDNLASRGKTTRRNRTLCLHGPFDNV